MIDQQVRNGVAKLAFRSLRIKALELNGIAPVLQRAGIHAGQDGLAGDAQMQGDEIVLASRPPTNRHCVVG